MNQACNDKDEKELIEGLISGSKPAFTGLYNKYSGLLLYRLRRMVKEEETAREMLQAIFVRIWERRTQLDPQKSFTAFLYKTGENEVYDYFRKVARDRQLHDALIAMAAVAHTQAEEAAVFDESLLLIEKAIELLPPVRRQVFRLCKLEGRSYDEVAAQLNISTSTISDHIVKANRFVKHYVHTHRDIAVGVLMLTWFRVF